MGFQRFEPTVAQLTGLPKSTCSQPFALFLGMRLFYNQNSYESLQEFSDDEDTTQTTLAPLPDEPEPVEGDEEEEDEEGKEEKENSVAPRSSQMTPMPAETSGLGVPGLDTPRSATPETPPRDLRTRTRPTGPHPLASSFGPTDPMEPDVVPQPDFLNGMGIDMGPDDSYMADISMMDGGNLLNGGGSLDTSGL